MPEVIFHNQYFTKHVEKSVLLCLKKYVDNYYEKDRIILSDSCDFRVFCHFIDFLVSGCVPSDRNDQIGVIHLLREWESHFGILDGFRFRLCSHEKDGIVIYNGEKYEVNIGCLLFHSGVFREFYKISSGMVFYLNLSYSQESFEVFLDLIHNRISYPSVEKAGDVYDICNSLHCDSLCHFLNDDSSERVLSLLIQNQNKNDEIIDFSKYERLITQKIDTYLKNPSFCLVSLPSLCRIFASSNQTFSLSSLEPFLIGCMKHHGTGAQCILSKIKYQKPSGISELNRFLHIMSIEGTNDAYDHTNHVLSSFQSEFESIRIENRKLSENIQQIVLDMNTKLKEQENINRVLKSEIVYANETIGKLQDLIRTKDASLTEKNRLILVKDSTIAEKNNLIQAKDATIDEKNRQINKSIEGEYEFKSDLFSGIFYGLSRKLGRNLAESSDIDVTASSITGSNTPKNVLKNDNSYWQSKDIPNSWIQFDFKERRVLITSYSMSVLNRVKSWKVEGSNDGSAFDIIDSQVESTVFQSGNNIYNHPSSQKNFHVQNNSKYYRYIRITSTSKTWINFDYFYISVFELFGFLKTA